MGTRYFIVMALLVAVVGSGAFFAGYFFANRANVGDYIALPVEEIPDEVYEPSEIEEVTETYEGSTAVAIYVLCRRNMRYEREALMRSMEDVLEVRYLLALRYLTPLVVDYWFYPDLRLVPVEINDDDDFQTPREAFARLSRMVRDYVEHEIAPDETLEEIAYAWDMDAHEILRINMLTEESPLEPGQRIWVLYIGPLIYVFTVEVAWDLVQILRDVETIFINTLPQNTSRIVQEGRDGLLDVEKRITRRGTEIIDELVYRETIILEPEPRIIELGR